MAETSRTPKGGRIRVYKRELLAGLDDRVEKAMRQTVEVVANQVRLLHVGQRSGRRYRIGKTPTKADKAAGRKFRTHQASAPWEPPAVWFGTLLRSIWTRVRPSGGGGASAMGWKGWVGTNVKYARWLEYGTRRMRPRPMWRPAVLKSRAKIKELWDAAARRGPRREKEKS